MNHDDRQKVLRFLILYLLAQTRDQYIFICSRDTSEFLQELRFLQSRSVGEPCLECAP